MSDPVARDLLLPSHARPRERAIGGADAAVGDLDTDVVRRAGGPVVSEIPPEYLKERAYGASVDVWDPAWPDDVKRAVIAAAPEVHRHKGTVYAVKTALAALGIAAEVEEWWQTTPRGAPYTFTVRAYVSGSLYGGAFLDVRMVRVAYASVMRAKPSSRGFDMFVGLRLPRTLGLAPALAGKAVLRVAMTPRVIIPVSSALGLAPVLVGRARLALAFTPALPR